MANACSLGLLELSVLVDWNCYANTTKSGKVEKKTTKSREVRGSDTKNKKMKGEVESNKKKILESKTTLFFLGLYIVKGS